MADRPNHEFLNADRRADEARIARAIKPAQRVQDEEAARLRRLDQRTSRQAAQQAPARSAPSRSAARTGNNRTRSRGTPGWLVIIAIAVMAAGFAGALYYLGSGWEEQESAAPVTGPVKVAPK